MDALIITIFLFLVPVFFLLFRRRRTSQRLPPGSLGVPIIGQSINLLWAMRANTADEWVQKRIRKYGSISKLSLFGKPTVFISGQAANKFVFTSNTINSSQPKSLSKILGDRCLIELNGQDHKRVRSALMSFLRPDSLKEYVGKIDEQVRKHLEIHWHGKEQVTVLPLMKTLTFNIISSLLIGVERGIGRDDFVADVQEMIEGMWSIPINLPFTRYNHSLKASSRVQKRLKDLIQKKRSELEQKKASPRQDLITCLLSIGDNEEGITEKEIIDNAMIVMVAGHDTSSVLITFLIRLFANNPAIHAAVLQEQEEIAKSKSEGEFLTWEDLARMKYTWKVALETLRVIPPLFGGFRKAVRDIEYSGYLIPKGWQVFWVTSMTHMDESIFPEPSKLDPSRFDNPASVPPYCFIPFGAGPRICPGYDFAKTETLVTIHYLVTRFAWKLLCTDNFFSRNPMPVPTKGLPILIAPRKPLC